MSAATPQEIAELLGIRAEARLIVSIAHLGASSDEIVEALADLCFERRCGEPRKASSPHIAELRAILDDSSDERESDGDDRRHDEA
jgi:hypothetical protein